LEEAPDENFNKGGLVVDPVAGNVSKKDILVVDGKIAGSAQI
jgi:adenine deaminase